MGIESRVPRYDDSSSAGLCDWQEGNIGQVLRQKLAWKIAQSDIIVIGVTISTQLMFADNLISKVTVWGRWVLEGAGPQGKRKGVE